MENKIEEKGINGLAKVHIRSRRGEFRGGEGV